MKLREWEVTKQDPLLTKAFKSYCMKNDMQIIKDGTIWLEDDGCIAIYDWAWNTSVANLDYTGILKEYEEVKNDVKLS